MIILKLRGKKIKVDGFIGTMCAVQLHSISQNLDKWTSDRNVSSSLPKQRIGRKSLGRHIERRLSFAVLKMGIFMKIFVYY